MTRILVADDHPLVRRNVRRVLEEEGYQVCGEAANGREAVEMTHRLKPDLAVIDLTMPELNGLDAARLILKKTPEARVLILTMHEEEALTREALATGAAACVVKSDIQLLITEIHSLLRSNDHATQASHLSQGERRQKLLIAGDTSACTKPGLTDREPERESAGRSRRKEKSASALSVKWTTIIGPKR